MAYSAPELLLVGAAQNLVLAGSSQNIVEGTDCFLKEREDFGQLQYDILGLW